MQWLKLLTLISVDGVQFLAKIAVQSKDLSLYFMCSDQHVKYWMPRGFPSTSSLPLDYHVKQYTHAHAHKYYTSGVFIIPHSKKSTTLIQYAFVYLHPLPDRSRSSHKANAKLPIVVVNYK